MAIKAWYKIDGLIPREDLREGKPLDTSEFAIHLDQVRNNNAPLDYQQPERFFERTYLTKSLTDLASQVVRRLSGETSGTSAIFNLSTQFGGGKTHALTLLYHLAKNGSLANNWTGVNKILKTAKINSIPEAAVAVFVGVQFDSITGRGGNDGTPLRKTPWGEIAFQLGGETAFNYVAEHEKNFIEPKGDVIRKLFPKDKPCLILMDEIINYISTYRSREYHNRFYNFLQALSETVRSLKNVVLVVSIPASEMEYTQADEADEQRHKKMLDRLGKAIVMSAESETSEIIRRRLFEWDKEAVTTEGKIMLPRDAIAICNEYAEWVIHHRQQIPSWFNVDNAKKAFIAAYPFHPTVLSVFERKWQVLPRFQRTRGILRLLALWVANAYQESYRKAHNDPLIGLGNAPLDDPLFRAAVFNQLGEERLEGAVTTDICGKQNAHAIQLDKGALETIKESRLHQKVATTIFFESNGGQQNTEATIPEIRLAVGDPNFDIVNVETVLEALQHESYYLLVNKNRYRFNISPNLNKILVDRRANIQSSRIEERVKAEIKKVFTTNGVIQVVCFPEYTNSIANQPVLNLAILSPEYVRGDDKTNKFIESIILNCGSLARTFKSAIIFVVANPNNPLREQARDLLAWEDIRDQETELNAEQKHQLKENSDRSKKSLQEAVWQSYTSVALWGKNPEIQEIQEIQWIDLGMINSSQANSMVSLIINRLKVSEEITNVINPRFLLRNWPPFFTEWSIKNIQDAFFASPTFPRLLEAKAVPEAIVHGVREGLLAYVGKSKNGYEPFIFNQPNFSVQDVEISDDVFVIKGEVAEDYEARIKDPPRLTQLIISPEEVLLKPGQKQTFLVTGKDQYNESINVEEINWSATGGEINFNGVLKVGKDEGNFIVTAQVEDISIKAKFTVELKLPHLQEKSENYNITDSSLTKSDRTNEITEGETSNIPNIISWRGEITPQKWMQFYTKVLSRFAAKKDFNLTVEINFSVTGSITSQNINETKVSLQELGLDDGIETS